MPQNTQCGVSFWDSSFPYVLFFVFSEMHFTNTRIAKQRDAKPALFVRSNARSSSSQSIDVPLRPASSIGISHDEVGLGHSGHGFFEDCGRNKTFFCMKFFQLRNHSHWVGYFALSGENFNKVTILSYAWSSTLFWKDEWVKTTLIYLYTCLAIVFFLLDHHWQT